VDKCKKKQKQKTTIVSLCILSQVLVHIDRVLYALLPMQI